MHCKLLTQQILLLQASSSAAPQGSADSNTLSIMYPPKCASGQQQRDNMHEVGSRSGSDAAGPSNTPGTPEQVPLHHIGHDACGGTSLVLGSVQR